MRHAFLFFIVIFLCICSVEAQIQFVNRNDLLHEKDVHSAVPVAIADMNGDGLDDIITLDKGTTLMIQYQTPDPARPFVRYRLPMPIDPNEQNDISIADFNNDGVNDILMVGSYDRVKVIYGIPNTYEYNLTRIIVVPFFSQGASTGDFNHDGWVDAVLLNDNGLNYTLINDGTGTLVQQNLFDFVTVPPSDNSGNYGCVYTDFDMDGDLDFYIAKCRQGVGNPNDPRRINALFVNDGQGNYTENAKAYGLANGRQSWTVDFADIDNDGDLDCFLTQHDVFSELFENINNDTFINITAQSGLNIGGIPLQGMFRDFDNDGFVDLLVSGDRLDYYHNNGDKTFTRMEPFGNVTFGTYALGDLNHDGFTDVYASRVIPFNNPDLLREDILFINQPNENHFIALALQDTAGNPTAIGAMALLYGPWGIQVREVRGGEQYGVSNGHKLIFGLGQHTSYDSLVIRWADGTRETRDDLSVDTHWNLRRGGCASPSLSLFPALAVICQEDSLIFKLDAGIDLITWSNGEIADSIIVRDKGLYYAMRTDTSGCMQKTYPVEVIVNPDTVKPVITYNGLDQLCDGEVAHLSLVEAASYQWSTGENTPSIQVTQSGSYSALVEGYCVVQESDTVVLEFFIPDLPVTEADTFKPGEVALLGAVGDSILWFADASGTSLLGSGPVLMLENLTDTTTVYAQNLISIDGLEYQLGPTMHSGNTKYNGTFINGGLAFEVYEPIILRQMTLFTDSVGTRIIEISDGIDFFFSYEVDMEAGANVVGLDVEIPTGSYTISTNTNQNNIAFGMNSPILWRSSSNILYPYTIDGVVSITNSTFGGDFFYYFYDWHVSTLDKYCTSLLVPATAYPDMEVSIDEHGIPYFPVVLTPNPSDGVFNIGINGHHAVDIEVWSLTGTKIYSENNMSIWNQLVTVDLSQNTPGVYILRLTLNGKSVTKKLVIL